jgi:hypothetical protein
MDVYAFAMVVFHDGWQRCMYQFLADFLLISRSTLFFLINKNEKSLTPFKKTGASLQFREPELIYKALINW